MLHLPHAGVRDATRNGACVGYRLPRASSGRSWRGSRTPTVRRPPRPSMRNTSENGRARLLGGQHGFCDVYGNVWEWTWEGGATRRVRLGGSWMHTREEASMRVQHSTSKRAPYLGFRPVRLLAPAAPIAFAGLRIEPMSGTVRAPGHARTLSPEAASVLFEGLRTHSEPVTLATLASRDGASTSCACGRGPRPCARCSTELGRALRLEPAGTDGVRLVVR
ncbi:MAG: SUMF1/EgtB/PvdO family nonheme iron enzyme [bacterium]